MTVTSHDIRVIALTTPLLSLALSRVLSEQPTIDFVGDIANPEDLPEDAGPAVEVVLLDCSCRAVAHLDALLAWRTTARRLLLLIPETASSVEVLQAVRSGSDGCVSLSSTAATLVTAIREVARGRSWLDSVMAPLVLEELRRPAFVAHDSDPLQKLNPRQREVLQLAAEGCTNAQIAKTLDLAEKTVRNIWSTLFEKIHMEDRTQVVLWAIRTGQVHFH